MIRYFSIKNKVAGYMIKCKAFVPEDKISGAFIMCHGFASSKDSRSVRIISEKLLENNIMSISFDFPMHGASAKNRNNLLVQNCIEDINYVYTYIVSKFKPQYISIFGVSFGGYIALLNAFNTKNNYKHIFLRAPAIGIGDIFMKDIAKEGEAELKKNGYVKSGFSHSIEATQEFICGRKDNDLLKVKDFSHDAIIYHGTDDNTIPLKNSYRFKENNKNANIEIIEINGAHHVMDNTTIENLANDMLKKIKAH